MIRVAVCEDSVHFQAQAEEYLVGFSKELQWEMFSTGEELLCFIEEKPRWFSIYFMDISLPGMNGIETAKAIRRQDEGALFIYFTDYREYVYEVFETLPFRFLVKPIKPAEFSRTLSAALEHLSVNSQLFRFKAGGISYQIPCREILYLEGELRKIHLHTLQETFTFYGRLEEQLRQFQESFFARTHKSYAVNLDYVRAVSDTFVTLKGDSLVPISRRFRSSFQEKHLEYLKRRCGTE